MTEQIGTCTAYCVENKIIFVVYCRRIWFTYAQLFREFAYRMGDDHREFFMSGRHFLRKKHEVGYCNPTPLARRSGANLLVYAGIGAIAFVDHFTGKIFFPEISKRTVGIKYGNYGFVVDSLEPGGRQIVLSAREASDHPMTRGRLDCTESRLVSYLINFAEEKENSHQMIFNAIEPIPREGGWEIFEYNDVGEKLLLDGEVLKSSPRGGTRVLDERVILSSHNLPSLVQAVLDSRPELNSDVCGLIVDFTYDFCIADLVAREEKIMRKMESLNYTSSDMSILVSNYFPC
jgi:hypothetical protein